MKTFVNAGLILEDRILPNGWLTENDGKIIAFGAMDEATKQGEIVDCQQAFLSPGFVDIHSHGGGGYDYMDGTLEDIIGAARAHLRHGVTSVLPTTLTSSDEDLFVAIEHFKTAQKLCDDMPCLLGLHLEGPYFDMMEKGAQDERFIRNPDPAHYMKILERADGCVKRISFAPELPGALEMADRLAGTGILLAAGHTAATYDQMREAFDHGITHLTHFYSGMSTITRRDGFRVLGAVESGYLIDGLTVELIADGIHLPPELLQLIVKCKKHEDICVCTDSMRGAGMPDGPSILGPRKGGQDVIIEDGIAKMPDRSCFAGSVATGDRLVRVMHTEAGLPLWEAVRMASLHPARFIGVEQQKGSLAVGKDADLVLFDQDVQVSAVYVAGIKIGSR